jgi:hypothetical protein
LLVVRGKSGFTRARAARAPIRGDRFFDRSAPRSRLTPRDPLTPARARTVHAFVIIYLLTIYALLAIV